MRELFPSFVPIWTRCGLRIGIVTSTTGLWTTGWWLRRLRVYDDVDHIIYRMAEVGSALQATHLFAQNGAHKTVPSATQPLVCNTGGMHMPWYLCTCTDTLPLNTGSPVSRGHRHTAGCAGAKAPQPRCHHPHGTLGSFSTVSTHQQPQSPSPNRLRALPVHPSPSPHSPQMAPQKCTPLLLCTVLMC